MVAGGIANVKGFAGLWPGFASTGAWNQVGKLSGVGFTLRFQPLFTAFETPLKASQALEAVIDFGLDALNLRLHPSDLALEFYTRFGDFRFQFVSQHGIVGLEFVAQR